MVLNQLDKQCLDLAIEEAQRSSSEGNYPVGAVICIGDKIFSAGNTAKRRNSLFYHSENSLIMLYGVQILEASKAGRKVILYSTLEPCIMCLGAAVMNKIDEIYYIQKDPHAGACQLNVDSIGVRYTERWPKIIHLEYSNKPYELLIKFFKRERDNGNDWGRKMLGLFETNYAKRA